MATSGSGSGSRGQTMQGEERGRGVGHECKWELGPDHTRGREREGHWPRVQVGAGARPYKGDREGGVLVMSASGSWGQTIQGREREREREWHWPRVQVGAGVRPYKGVREGVTL